MARRPLTGRDSIPEDFEETLPDPLRAHRNGIAKGIDSPTVPEDLSAALFAPAGPQMRGDNGRSQPTVSLRGTVPRSGSAVVFEQEDTSEVSGHLKGGSAGTERAAPANPDTDDLSMPDRPAPGYKPRKERVSEHAPTVPASPADADPAPYPRLFLGVAAPPPGDPMDATLPLPRKALPRSQPGWVVPVFLMLGAVIVVLLYLIWRTYQARLGL
jgi:hypothetical protein